MKKQPMKHFTTRRTPQGVFYLLERHDPIFEEHAIGVKVIEYAKDTHIPCGRCDRAKVQPHIELSLVEIGVMLECLDDLKEFYKTYRLDLVKEYTEEELEEMARIQIQGADFPKEINLNNN